MYLANLARTNIPLKEEVIFSRWTGKIELAAYFNKILIRKACPQQASFS